MHRFLAVRVSPIRVIRTGPVHSITAHTCVAPLSTSPPASQSWLDKLASMIVSNKETVRIYNAETLYLSCANQSSRKAWFGRGRVSKDFLPQHSLLLTHIWMVHKRLSSPHLSSLFINDEGKEEDHEKMIATKDELVNPTKSNFVDKEYHLFQEELFDKLWEDTAVRIRALGVNELMVNKHVVDVQKATFPVLLSYDEAVAKGTEEEVLDNLGAAVWRNIWKGDTNMTAEHCMVMVDYMNLNLKMLYELEKDFVMQGRIPWEQVPSWKGVKSVVKGGGTGVNKLKSTDNQLIDVVGGMDGDMDGDDVEEDLLENEKEEDELGDWREALDVTGKTYYWNVVTRESSWEKPKEM